MGIAKSRLIKELTIQQVIHGTAKAWEDDEPDVLRFVAEILDADSIRRRTSGLTFYYPYYEEVKDNDEKVARFRTRWLIVGGIGAVTVRLREMARDSLDWDFLKVTVYRGTLTKPQKMSVPFKDIMIQTEEVTNLLRAEELTVPEMWPPEREGTRTQEQGKTVRLRGRRRRARDAAKRALDTLYPKEIPNKPWKTLTAEVNNSLTENNESPVSEDTVRRAANRK